MKGQDSTPSCHAVIMCCGICPTLISRNFWQAPARAGHSTAAAKVRVLIIDQSFMNGVSTLRVSPFGVSPLSFRFKSFPFWSFAFRVSTLRVPFLNWSLESHDFLGQLPAHEARRAVPLPSHWKNRVDFKNTTPQNPTKPHKTPQNPAKPGKTRSKKHPRTLSNPNKP